MAGTKAGGKRASETNRRKYGDNYYRYIGRLGGKNGTTGGFAANPNLARLAGKKGGRVSRRRSVPYKVSFNEEILPGLSFRTKAEAANFITAQWPNAIRVGGTAEWKTHDEQNTSIRIED